ncbi:uncharacterized protein mthl15 isoform X2 [Drosophila virilis]|uniref:uncharacterized protein mthl15 isoform X2 n=1 Tax=Drosophila virilis TaxID=7244 RepID=UPI00139610D6|nr:uncharacterized protein LOC6636632 isoform X2 [Drosophila virilis]
MCVKLVLMYLIFSYLVTNNNSIQICCTPQSILYKSQGSNNSTYLKCIHAMDGLNETVNPTSMDMLGKTESPQGYGLEILKEISRHMKLLQCAHTSILNISLFTEISVNVSPESCLLIVNNSLIVVTCKSSIGDELQSIGFVNKCCPHGYTYVSELNKCYLREPDFNVYSSIFDKPMIFVDNSFVCPKNNVLVEYVVEAKTIHLKKRQILLKDYGRSFKRNEFCIEAIEVLIENRNPQLYKNNEQFLVRTCQQLQICDSVPCIRKCCADGEIYYKGNMTTSCIGDENNSKFQSLATMNLSGVFTKPSEFGVLTGLECSKFRLDPESFADESHVISSTTGSLLISSTSKIYSNSQYCIEKIKNSSYADQKLYTFLCFDSKVLNNDRIRFKMYPVGLLISCCFYAITLLVYTSIEKLRNLPGKILICLVSSLLFAYLGIALGQLFPTKNDDMCFLSGFLVYFFLMAAFSWMNITCFDIWKTFGFSANERAKKKWKCNLFNTINMCSSKYIDEKTWRW